MEHCCKCQLPGSHCQLEWPSVFTLPRKLHRLTQHTSEDVRPYCSLLMTIQPLLSVLLPFAPVSCFQMSPSYDETLTSLSWALDFPGPLCGAGLPMTHPVKAWAGSKRWAGECLWASWRDWTRGKLRRFPSLVTGSGWKEPRAQNHSEWIILECNVRSCLPLYPQDPEHSGCRVNTWWMPIVASCLYGPNTEPSLGAWHRAVSRGLTSSPRPPSALFTDCCGALAGCLLLREELRLRNGGKASPVAGLHWLSRAWLSSQVQSTLCVMNDIETYPWQPAGPSPDLCKHQPEAALVLRQPGDSPSQPRFFRPPRGTTHTSPAVSQLQTWADEFSVVFHQRISEGNVIVSPPSVCLCLPWQRPPCDLLFSALIALIWNALSRCLPLVLRDLNCRHGFDRNDRRMC